MLMQAVNRAGLSTTASLLGCNACKVFTEHKVPGRDTAMKMMS
jgi:hypothetical protein